MNDKKDSRLERLIEEEIERAILEEGIVDWLKKGVQAAAGAWEKLAGRVKQAAAGMKQILVQKLQQVQQAYPKAMEQYNAIKAIEAQSGEKIPQTSAMKTAQELPAAAKAAIAETTQEKQQVANAVQNVQQNQKQTPEAQQAQEAYMEFTAGLLEEMANKYKSSKKETLKEDEDRMLKEIDPFGVAGLALGIVGGLPLLIKGLLKLAKFFKLTATADFLTKVYHVAHHIEEKVIDVVIPDRLSYMVYRKWFLTVSGQGKDKILPFEQYRTSKIRKNVEKNMYVVLLIPFLLHGISGVAHAGLNMLGAAEGAASTVKAVEIGTAIVDAVGATGAKVA